MKRVLRRMGYVTKQNVIEMKGRIACEINAADELVITEMIFTGFFKDLTPEQISAILVCFVMEKEGKDSANKLKEELNGPLRQMQEIARRVATVCKESKIPIDVEEYVAQFTPTMMEVAYKWCQGDTFAEICKLTSIFEGNIIRGLRRLEELVKQLVNAAKAIGNTELENKFAEIITKIKRDIVFAASLYL